MKFSCLEPELENVEFDEERGVYVDTETGKMYYNQSGTEEYDPTDID